MNELWVSLIQSDLQWENPEANRNHFTKIISAISQETDLIILPEMFTTGFSMCPEKLAETSDGVSLLWMKDLARQKNCVLTGSIIIEDKGSYYNRLYWVKPDGSFSQYDKRHLFSLAHEEDYYTAGNKRLVVELKGFKIMPLICYDLRFPVWSRNDIGYDLLIYVANWPARRAFFWRQLLIGRAIENQAYVIGVNRVGEDGNQVAHSGDSVCLGPLGETIEKVTPSQQGVAHVCISRSELDRVRNKFMFLGDQDNFKILT